MEDIIQKLIDLDHECYQRVKQAKQKHSDISSIIEIKKNEIHDQYISIQEKKLEEHRKTIKVKSLEEEKIQEHMYQETLANLDKTYEENKEKWVISIVERCLT